MGPEFVEALNFQGIFRPSWMLYLKSLPYEIFLPGFGGMCGPKAQCMLVFFERHLLFSLRSSGCLWVWEKVTVTVLCSHHHRHGDGINTGGHTSKWRPGCGLPKHSPTAFNCQVLSPALTTGRQPLTSQRPALASRGFVELCLQQRDRRCLAWALEGDSGKSELP